MDIYLLYVIIPLLVFIIPLGFSQANSSSCRGKEKCSSSPTTSAPLMYELCCPPPMPNLSPKSLFLRSLSPRSLSPLLPPSSPLPQPPSAQRNRTVEDHLLQNDLKSRATTISPPPLMSSLPIWSNWYFWLLVALLLLLGMAACGYWRRRKIYESSASQTLSNVNGLFPTPTPSDDTPLYGPPLPFLPPAAYPAPPPYSEAARPSYDRLDHRHLYDALLSGRSVHDFYDRRHPNAYYDRYFLPDDTSSSETTSLLSYRLHHSSSAHLPKHHSVRKCHDMPPPYSEVAAKPELYPVVVVKGSDPCGANASSEIQKTSKCERNSQPHHWLPPHQYYSCRSGSISTPEGSQASSVPGLIHHQNVIEWWRGPRGTISPATLLASCSGIPSPASSSGPLPSEVSSLAPTSPPSPPAPTSPTQQPHALQASPTSTREFRDVLHKISQLPRASSPTSPSGLSSECHSPGGMLSPVPLTPGTSPGSTSRPGSCSRGSQTPWRSVSPLSSPRIRRSKHHLMASLSMEGDRTPIRPQSLSLGGEEIHPLSSSASTPNLLSSWPQTPDHELGPALTRSRITFDISLTRSRVTLDTSPSRSRLGVDNPLVQPRVMARPSCRRWWDQQSSVHHV